MKKTQPHQIQNKCVYSHVNSVSRSHKHIKRPIYLKKKIKQHLKKKDADI